MISVLHARRQGCSILRPIGTLARGARSADLASAVRSVLLAGGRRVVLDLSGVPYLDAHGLGCILQCDDRVRARGGTLVLAAASPRVRDLLRLMRLTERLILLDDVPAALRQLLADPGATAAASTAVSRPAAQRQGSIHEPGRGPDAGILQRSSEGPCRSTLIPG